MGVFEFIGSTFFLGLSLPTILGILAGAWAILTIVHYLRAEGEYRRLHKETLAIAEEARKDIEERRIRDARAIREDSAP